MSDGKREAEGREEGGVGRRMQLQLQRLLGQKTDDDIPSCPVVPKRDGAKRMRPPHSSKAVKEEEIQDGAWRRIMEDENGDKEEDGRTLGRLGR